MRKRNISPRVSLGKGFRIEDSAFVGQEPIRKIKQVDTVIGCGAVCLRGSIIYLGSRIGKNLLMGHNAVIREENRIGDDFKLWNNSVIDYGCIIGNNVKVHCNCYIAQYTRIEDNVFIAPGVIISNDLHPGCKFSKKCLKGPVIKKGAQVGTNVTILPYVTIGEDAIVGAGSVVVKDIPPGKVVCGNPAKIIKSIKDINCTLYPGKKYQK